MASLPLETWVWSELKRKVLARNVDWGAGGVCGILFLFFYNIYSLFINFVSVLHLFIFLKFYFIFKLDKLY